MIKGTLIVIIAALIGVIIEKKVILPFIEWICELF